VRETRHGPRAEGERLIMTLPTSSPASSLARAPAASQASRFVQLSLAAFLAMLVIGVAGFSPIAAIHNAAHNVRHSLAFPCH
jgi:cobalt transporter subunit CbtB